MKNRIIYHMAIVYYVNPKGGGIIKNISYNGHFTDKSSPELYKSFTEYGRYVIYNNLTAVNTPIEEDGSNPIY